MNRRDATETADDRELDEFFASRGVDMGAHRAVFASIRAAAVLTTVMEELALRPLGLSHAGYRLLCELWIKGPLELRSLAGFMMVSRPSIVGTVHTLESAGLVGRTRSEVDRRLVTIAITGSGLELVERADASWHRCQVEVTRTLSEGQKAGLADLNDRLFRAALKLRRRS